MQLENKSYVIILQCDIVMERCSGYFCEKSLHEREGGFSKYPKDKQLRVIYMTCGGCCGRATQRKVSHLIKKIGIKEKIPKDKIIVQMASCITQDNHHGPMCPHVDYIKELLDKINVDYREDTWISTMSEKKRLSGEYKRADHNVNPANP
ncbi:CGGC domain-containing protein [Candidatus Omnitrophota bacterium]